MNAPRILTTSIATLAALLSGTPIALAGSAAWLSSGTTGGWNDPANWTPATVPNGPADVATFGSTDQLIPFALVTANTEVNGIVFNPGAPSYSIGAENVMFTISGTGIMNNSAAIEVLSAGGASGALRFQNSATAGNANVAIVGQNGGTVLFTGSSTGGTARLVAQSTGAVDISGLTTGGMTAGFIVTDNVGSNFFRLGSKTLTVGSSNSDSTVFGVIADGGTAGGVGGSIVKVGTGTMTFAGSAPNTNTGTTFVNEGTLDLDKTSGVDAIRGPLVVGDGLGAAGTALLQIVANENIHDNQPVTVNENGMFRTLFATSESIASLTVNEGNIVVFSDSNLVVLGNLRMTGGTIGGFGRFDLQNSAIQATSDSGGMPATMSARVQLRNNANYTFTVNDGPGAADLLITGRIDDGINSASIAKAGGGVMVLSGSNTYDGSTTITAGTLSISDDANLGTPPASPTANHLVFDGGTLRATAGFSLNGNRGITLNAGGGTVEVTAGFLNYDGIVAGPGVLSKTGRGTLVFFGTAGNTHTGTTAVNDGFVVLARSRLNKTILGPLTIGDGIGTADSTVVFTDGHQISDTAPVTILPDGKLNINEATGETIGSLTIVGGNLGMASDSSLSVSGPLAMTGGTIAGGTTTLFGTVTASSDAGGLAATISSAVNLGGATRSFTVNDGPSAVDLNVINPVSNGGITKTGAGTLALGGASSYAGPTTIIAGKLILTGSISGTTTVVANGATLQGTGTTGPLTINAGATLVPGLSAGTLSTGNLTLHAASTVSFELAVAGVAGGGVNDLVAVNGDLMYGGTLAITTLPGFGPGAYPMFTYTGAAVNQGLAFESSFLAAHPGSTIQLDTINKRLVANIPALQSLPGDYNQNGTVDAADYVVWRKGLGTTYTQNDYTVWRANFGKTVEISMAQTSSSVPEASTIAILFAAIALRIGTRLDRGIAQCSRWSECRAGLALPLM